MRFSFIQFQRKFSLGIAFTLFSIYAVFNHVEAQFLENDSVSMKHFQQSLNADTLNGDTIISKLQRKINKAYSILDTNPDEANLIANEIQTLAAAAKDKEGLSRSYDIRYWAARNMGEDSLAYVHLTTYISAKTVALEDKNSRLQEELHDKYSIRQKESDIALLKNDRKLHQLKLANNKSLFKIALPSFFLLLVLSFILWRQYRRKKNLQLMLKENHTKTTLLNTELIHINTELVKSEQELKRLNEVKNSFFSVVSQDLKSPLNSLSLYLNNFVEYNADDDAHNFVERINTSVASLSTLLNNLLEWSRLQMGNMQYHAEVLDISELLENNIALIQPQTAHKRILLKQKLQPGIKSLVDKQMLGFVIRKVLSLYIEAVEEDGVIVISSKRMIKERDLLRIKIKSQYLKDTNNGLLNAWEFNKDYMDGSEKSRSNMLGLMLCKEFIEKQGGTIHISNSKKSIVFTFPLA